MNNSQGKKISEFVSQPTIPSDGQFAYVANGVNYRVSFSEMLPQLGATGTITQTGDPLQVPVLDTQGTNYRIRNIEAGNGIVASVSAQNGVTIAHNFANSGDGVEILKDTSTAQPKLRSLRAGAGINVTLSGDEIQFSTTPSPVSTKTVVINQLSDFPAPVSGIINLVAGTQYLIYNNIALGTNRIKFADQSSITGSGSASISMTYSGADSMFFAEGVSIRLADITLSCPSGAVFASADPSFTKTVQLFSVTVDDCNTIGTIDGISSFISFYTNFAKVRTNGLVVTSACSLGVFFIVSAAFMDAGKLADISGASSVGSFTVSECIVNFGAASVRLVKGNGDTNITNTATVVNTRTIGSASTILDGVSVDNVKWIFSANDKLPDTNASALLSMTGNITATTISGAGTPALVAGTWVSRENSHFTNTAAGRATYNGTREDAAGIDAAVTILAATGGTITVSAYLAVNGSVVSATRMRAALSSSAQACIPLHWHRHFVAGDYVEVFVANDTNTTNLVVQDAVLRVV